MIRPVSELGHLDVVVITDDVEVYRSDFEQASSYETAVLVAGSYAVEFVTVAGRPTDRENAYYARVKVAVRDARFSYKWEAPKPNPSREVWSLELYSYEYDAGKEFWARSPAGESIRLPFARLRALNPSQLLGMSIADLREVIGSGLYDDVTVSLATQRVEILLPV